MSKRKVIDRIIKQVKKGRRGFFGGVEKYTVSDFIRTSTREEAEKIPYDHRSKTATDFALINNAYQNRHGLGRSIHGNYKTSNYFLSTAAGNCDGCVLVVKSNGEIRANSVDTYSIGLSPALHLELPNEDELTLDLESITGVTNGVSDHVYYHTLTLGEYPQLKLNKNAQKYLNKRFSSIKPTNRYYIVNGALDEDEKYATRLVPEYEFNDNKYVLFQNDDDSGNFAQFKDGTRLFEVIVPQWFEVKPVSFIIRNWDRLPVNINPNGKKFNPDKYYDLESEEVLIANLPFYPKDNEPYNNLWQNSLHRAYLNSNATDMMDGSKKSQADIKFDFRKGGFLNEAFNPGGEKIFEYTVPDNEAEVCDYAFFGCKGLKRITIPSHVTKIGNQAFVGLGEECQIWFTNPNRKTTINSAFSLGNTKIFENNFKYVYLTKDGDNVVLSAYEDPSLEEISFRKDIDKSDMSEFSKYLSENYRKNLIAFNQAREQGKLKFMPPDYTLSVFPNECVDDYFVNKNYARWGKLVKYLKFDQIDEAQSKENSLTDLMKIYYAIGGFSTNQGESEKAYEYILANIYYEGADPNKLGEDVHARFSRFNLKGKYNPTFAQFFMKYYADDNEFMVFDINDDDLQDYLAPAHNNFATILKNFPNRVVNGNEERALLTPQFVAEHSNIVEYDYVDDGNEELASIVGGYGYDEDDFEEIQEIFNDAKELEEKRVIRVSAKDDDEKIRYRVLAKDDPYGFVIGDISNCCQHINGAGEECVEDGYLDENAGFITFEDNEKYKAGMSLQARLLAQAYVWYDPVTKTVCFDNIEIPTKILTKLRASVRHEDEIQTQDLMRAIVKSADDIMDTMTRNGHEVRRVTTGRGYNDLKEELSELFGNPESPPTAKHRGYDGYTDADNAQYIIRSIVDRKTKERADVVDKILHIHDVNSEMES